MAIGRTIVLDTNLLVSAALQLEAPPGQIVQRVLRRELACFTCPGIVDEYWDVMTRKKFARLGFPPPWLEQLVAEARHLTQDPAQWPLLGPDPDDLIFLALAEATGAVLVTGNLADFPEGIRRGVQVIGPRDYMEALEI